MNVLRAHALCICGRLARVQSEELFLTLLQGADVLFKIQGGEGAIVAADAELQVYTTRPDTLFGVTYMVVAPEHPLLDQLTTTSQRSQVAAYVQTARNKSDLERTGLQKDKTGIFTGKERWPEQGRSACWARSARYMMHTPCT